MLYSRRKKLEEEYYKWLNIKREGGVFPVDCAFSVITFLAGKGLLKEEENNEESYTY